MIHDNNVLVLDDLFSSTDFNNIKKYAESYYSKPTDASQSDDIRNYDRWHPDPDSPSIRLLMDKIWNTILTQNIADASWKSVSLFAAHYWEIQLTKYQKDGFYQWHEDLSNPYKNLMMLNFIFYLSDVEGGELVISNKKDHGNQWWTDINYSEIPEDLVVNPRPNRLVVAPSWKLHKVNKVTNGERITLNGHIGVQLEI